MAKLVLLADTLLVLYRHLLRVRRADERLVRSFSEGLIPGEYASSIGQEAVYVGVGYHLQPTDLVFGNHHAPGQAVAKGVPLRDIFAELYGRVAGCAEGRGGVAFITDPEQGMFSSAGIAGASLVHAAGAAYAMRVLHPGCVAVCYFGDTAVATGTFHEVLNLAGLHKLPLLLVYEGNGFAGRMRTSEVIVNPKIAVRSKNYEVFGVEVDGNDVSSVYAAAFEGIRRAREGRGATLLECMTTRQRPHSEAEAPPSTPSSAVNSAALLDPLTTLANRLISSDFASSAELTALDAEIRREVEQVHEEAVASSHSGPAAVRPTSGSSHA